MAAFPEEPYGPGYGVAGFHNMAAPGFDYSSSDSESTDSGFERGGSLSTDSDDDSDGSEEEDDDELNEEDKKFLKDLESGALENGHRGLGYGIPWTAEEDAQVVGEFTGRLLFSFF